MNRGIGLAEVTIAILLVSLCVVPIFMLFSTSRRMQGSARQMAIAISHANSMISALEGKLRNEGLLLEYQDLLDADLPPGFHPEELGLAQLPEGLWRKSSLTSSAVSGLAEVRVFVGWQSQEAEDSARFGLISYLMSKSSP